MSFDDYDEGLNEPEYDVTETEFREGLKEEGLDEKEINELLEDESSWSDEEVIKLADKESTDKIFRDEFKVLTEEQKFEKAKQALKDKQSNRYENPDKIYVEIKIPTTGKVGEECIIKISEKVPIVEWALSEKLQWKKKYKYDRNADKEIVATPFQTGKEKDTDTIKIKWQELDGRGKNVLRAGDYFLEVSARSKKAGQDTTSGRIIEVTK
jgi:hypothetical protein